MSTPEAFSNQGLNLLTQWQQNYEQMVAFASVFEARGGMGQFNNAKVTPPVTPEDEATNAALDAAAFAALDVVTHFNELKEWYNAGRQARVAIRRLDY